MEVEQAKQQLLERSRLPTALKELITADWLQVVAALHVGTNALGRFVGHPEGNGCEMCGCEKSRRKENRRIRDKGEAGRRGLDVRRAGARRRDGRERT